jgi:hypothetical protein
MEKARPETDSKQNGLFPRRLDGKLSLTTRVTRLGEVLPDARSLIMDSFVTIAEIAQIFGLLLATVKVMHSFLTKVYWSTFW